MRRLLTCKLARAARFGEGTAELAQVPVADAAVVECHGAQNFDVAHHVQIPRDEAVAVLVPA